MSRLQKTSLRYQLKMYIYILYGTSYHFYDLRRYRLFVHSSTVIDSRTKRTHEGKMRKTLFFSKSNR